MRKVLTTTTTTADTRTASAKALLAVKKKIDNNVNKQLTKHKM